MEKKPEEEKQQPAQDDGEDKVNDVCVSCGEIYVIAAGCTCGAKRKKPYKKPQVQSEKIAVANLFSTSNGMPPGAPGAGGPGDDSNG